MRSRISQAVSRIPARGRVDAWLGRSLRGFLERRSRKIVFRRRLPHQFGQDPIFVSPEAMLKFWSPGLERLDGGLFGWATEFVGKGATVWDVGANVGLFTFAAAHLAGPSGRVLAVEADTWLVDLLRRSARSGVNPRAPVDVLPAAVSGSIDVARLNIAERSRASNFIAGSQSNSQTGGIRETQLVLTVTLDWLLERFPSPDVVKIDVEGAEDRVLEGARTLLEEVRPIILCEVARHNVEAVGSLLRSQGYTLFDLDEAGKRRPRSLPPFNTLAVPSTADQLARPARTGSLTANMQNAR